MLSIPDEIKALLFADSCKKNIRIHFPNGEREDICNDLIVKDSVSFKESLCSQSTLKFGLCEASVFECEAVGVENIEGMTIDVYCEVYCDSSIEDAVFKADIQGYVYQIPYGKFIVKNSERQSDLNHRKIIAYGGQAVYDWNIEPVEKQKYCLAENYTPNLGYFLMVNGINIIKDWTDKTTEEWNSVDWNETFPINNSAQYVFEVKIAYKYKEFSDASPVYAENDHDAVYEVDDGVYNEYANVEYLYDQIYQFFRPYEDSSDPYYRTITMSEDALKSVLIRLVLGCVTYYRYLSGGSVTSTTVTGLRNRCFYPFSNGYYEATTTNRALLMVGTSITLNYKISGGIINTKTITIANSAPGFYKYKYSEDAPAWSTNYLTLSVLNSYHPSFYGVDLLADTNALIELSGVFGYLPRGTLTKMEFLNIKQIFNLLPENSLYPSSYLFPQGTHGGKLLPQDYQSCWYDDNYTLPFGKIKCEYTDTSNNHCLYELYLPGFGADTSTSLYQTYDISNNEIIRMVNWSDAQIQTICNTIAENIEGVTYMPVKFVGRGLPFVEAGDTFEVLTPSGDSITTIVLNRTIKGEMVLTDNYTSV